MFQAVDYLHKALHIESPWAFILTVATLFGLLAFIGMGVVAWIVERGYQHKLESGNIPASVPTTVEAQMAKPVTSRGASVNKSQSHTVIQTGKNNISQIGTGNVATINPEVNPNAPVITYDFNGAKRTTLPGSNHVEVGEQHTKFTEMSLLERAGKWQELKAAAESQIIAAPGWLTPYLLKAQAIVNLPNGKSNREEAIKLCEFVKRKSGGNPEFDNPANMLLRALNAIQ